MWRLQMNLPSGNAFRINNRRIEFDRSERISQFLRAEFHPRRDTGGDHDGNDFPAGGHHGEDHESGQGVECDGWLSCHSMSWEVHKISPLSARPRLAAKRWLSRLEPFVIALSP